MKVICIDDSDVELEFASRVLGGAGYDVHTRSTLRGIEPVLVDADIILIDFHMPGIDGGEMLTEIRGLRGRLEASLWRSPRLWAAVLGAVLALALATAVVLLIR